MTVIKTDQTRRTGHEGDYHVDIETKYVDDITGAETWAVTQCHPHNTLLWFDWFENQERDTMTINSVGWNDPDAKPIWVPKPTPPKKGQSNVVPN